MPGGLPLGLDVCNGVNAGANAATSLGTAVTASGSTNTKGSWTQLTASTASDCVFVDVQVFYDAGPHGGGPQIVAVDIGVGGAGSEVVLVPNLVMSPSYITANIAHFTFPLSIPAGTRVSARVASTIASDVVNVSVTMFDGSFTMMEGCAGVDAVGFNSGTTRGTAVAPSASANTMGSFAQLVASTARDYIGVFGMCDTQLVNPSSQYLVVDIGIGGAGSEIVIIPSVQIMKGTAFNSAPFLGQVPFIPISIPAGTRIAARCQSSIVSGATLGLTLYGVYQ